MISNASQNATAGNVTLAIAADAGAWRYALLGANVLSDLANDPPATGSDAEKMKDFSLRLMGWLVGSDLGDGTGHKIVVSHLADSYWFKHDSGTAKFLADNLPNATVNAEDSCENEALDGCLDGTSLLIISDQDTEDDDNNSNPANINAVMSAIDKAASQGIAVLYVHYDGGVTPLGQRLLSRFRVTTTDNYWDIERLAGFSPTSLVSAKDDLAALKTIVHTLGDESLAVTDYQSCIDDVGQFADCESAAFVSKIGHGANVLRATMNGLDSSGTNPYELDGFHLVRTLEQLGQSLRSGGQLVYPIPVATDAQAFAKAIFADSSTHYAQRCSAPQSDLGTFVCPRQDVLNHTCSTYNPAQIDTFNSTIEESFLLGDKWTSTGLYALRGVPFVINRTDSVLGDVWVRINFQREGTTRSMESQGNQSSYDRPAYLASPWVLVEKGRSITLTSPYGGPIYLSLSGSQSLVGQKTQINFTGVAHHPALLDVGDPAAVDSFVSEVSQNPLPHVDIRGTGFEVHLRKDKLLSGVTAPYNLVDRADGSSVQVDYQGDVGLLLADFLDNFIVPEYRMAGFAPPGYTLDQTLSDDVKTVCSNLGWACTDTSIHSRTTVQHANYDEYAACGSGCSGNPFDADWYITPLGWGESHELGHNLQTGPLQIHYVSSAQNNDWSQYENRASENSNNMFPYHNLWRWLRQVKGDNSEVIDEHMNLKELYAMVQSSKAGITRQINGQTRKVVFNQNCELVGDYPTSIPDVHSEAIWQDGSYAATNGPRMGFYLQLPMKLQGKSLRDGTTLTDGFDIFTLLYAHSRLFQVASADDTTWMNQRDSLGFGLFAREGDATYGGASVGDIPGNDFLLVSLSFLTGKDFRPYFVATGVRFSDLAAQQVDAHINAGLVSGTIDDSLIVLETDLPPTDISSVELVAPDGVAAWPRDGFHPDNCP